MDSKVLSLPWMLAADAFEGLGAVTSLQQKGLASSDAPHLDPQIVTFTREDQRRQLTQPGDHFGDFGLIGICRLLHRVQGVQRIQRWEPERIWHADTVDGCRQPDRHFSRRWTCLAMRDGIANHSVHACGETSSASLAAASWAAAALATGA